MMKLTLSLKNSTKQNSAAPQNQKPKLSLLLILLCAQLILSSCAPTYPARTLTQQLAKLAKEEGLNVTCRIAGKTMWVYINFEDLIDKTTMAWNAKELEKVGKVISIVHRAILSTDAKLDFLAIVATDTKNFGVELKTFEYVPDISQAMLEKFSRGEFFARSIRDVSYNPHAINDKIGESNKFYDITFNQFLCLQIIHRAKNLFYKDRELSKLFEVRSSSWSEKFGVLKIELEVMKKRYDLTPEEEKIDPLDYVKMLTAQIVKNYDHKAFQAIELTDTFSKKMVKLSLTDLKKIRIKLPEVPE
ncbi:MAG: hypothetical protein AUJ74_01165 [Candidatus Omnitrophica bacterium CG1_02_44_16]|nr:MAG: hypothetical protein AUJ74_01165 [Candidatus Omnitrophica bacterium CG1_02_44_16]PIY82441.1 MAG: hypothetical protein COY78_06295 [Candidatus Omnitrophica bacterium CG_4_10_14_0_8_um_filter_44_12]PIZ84670.1 MAG: hypothetical protein COX96_02645 [Candidatus Omnitrophica bacterium CG_4_10_14_0_2_um_filter_44_9]